MKERPLKEKAGRMEGRSKEIEKRQVERIWECLKGEIAISKTNKKIKKNA